MLQSTGRPRVGHNLAPEQHNNFLQRPKAKRCHIGNWSFNTRTGEGGVVRDTTALSLTVTHNKHFPGPVLFSIHSHVCFFNAYSLEFLHTRCWIIAVSNQWPLREVPPWGREQTDKPTKK